ncbi:hypothetical protein PInf_014216 [Phytophthora infestans]|nr:hypothetical protein PInf_014216 [Phytophthora infestans]
MAWSAQWAALGPYLGTMLPRFAVQLTQLIGPLSGILVAPTIGVLSYIYIFGAAHLTLRWFLGMLLVTMLASVGAVCVFAKEEVPVSKDVGLGSDEEAPSAMKRIGEAFSSIFHGLKTLPRTLAFGFTAYNGSKGQFFGIEVFGGNATDADVCGPSECSEDQERYNDGVQIAGGLADLLFNVFGYLYSWVLPLLVYRLGARWVITVACIPQSLLMVMAFTKVVAVDVTIVVLTAITQATIFALIVPLIVHVFGTSTQVGMYVGAVNSANCVGQLVNFLVGAALVETSLGYALPVFVGGAFSLLGALISFGLLRIDMHSM